MKHTVIDISAYVTLKTNKSESATYTIDNTTRILYIGSVSYNTGGEMSITGDIRVTRLVFVGVYSQINCRC